MASGTSEGLLDVWGVEKGEEVFACGYAGIFRFDGTDWEKMDSGTTQSVFNIWGLSGDDIYAHTVRYTGNGQPKTQVLHYDGERWAPLSDSPVYAYSFWGAAPDNIWTTGGNGYLANWDGETWTEPDPITKAHLHDIWGVSESKIFAVGGGWLSAKVVVLEYDGERWTDLKVPVGNNLHDIWGTSATNFYVTGGGLFHFDGTEWGVVASEFPAVYGISGSSDDDIFGVGETAGASMIIHYGPE
ncbi:MAG: hypothetical protein IH969_03415 [Candidatus Krumholzibacteriota bacterium]|nr:hypothetical protein [Candidatus Krumholzibacteriota bacterium]